MGYVSPERPIALIGAILQRWMVDGGGSQDCRGGAEELGGGEEGGIGPACEQIDGIRHVWH